MRRILGIANDMRISSAALVEDGQVVAAASEERFTRRKHTREFPINAVRHCLEGVKGGLAGVDLVAVSADPSIDLSSRHARYAGPARWYPESLFAVPNNLADLLEEDFTGPTSQVLRTRSGEVEVCYVYHHLAHAANGFFLSPFDRAAVLTVDGRGEDCTALFGWGEASRISVADTVAYPHSLGLFYGTVTQFLGFRLDRDEWKVMGLAAYGERDTPAYKTTYTRLRDLVHLRDDGRIELELNYFRYYLQPVRYAYSPCFVEAFGPPRQVGEPIEQQYANLAAAAQQVLEEALAHMLCCLHQRVGGHQVALSGGTFMNSVLNGQITGRTPFEEAFVSSCPDDAGTAIGAALYLHGALLNGPRPQPQRHSYYGPSYANQQIAAVLERAKLRARFVDDVERYTAAQLASGRIVGWFQGAMEFGQRALGNRSILADPRAAETRDLVNAAVKFREPFRPFAPAVLAEDFSEFFAVDGVSEVPFMEKTLPVRADRRALVPAVVHVDGTARPQTVSATANPRFHRLLAEFKHLTGVGVLLNTSFNLNEEPIVCTPEDALRTFYSSGLDVLVLGNWVLAK